MFFVKSFINEKESGKGKDFDFYGTEVAVMKTNCCIFALG
jgi:hypothetical protein